ncbi:hypothetical protein D1007_17483 [Hordeum vulgare]|nr:hypothetical protein D1007_17483 [Hordeum vulgare]
MCLKDANPWLEEPKELAEKTSTWSFAKLSDPRVVPVLERFSRDISAKRLAKGMIVKEFLAQRLAPLQPYSRPCGSTGLVTTSSGSGAGTSQSGPD